VVSTFGIHSEAAASPHRHMFIAPSSGILLSVPIYKPTNVEAKIAAAYADT